MPIAECKDIDIYYELHGSGFPAENAQRMAEHIPNSRVKILPQAGHLIHMEQMEEFNQTLHEFFQAKL